MDSGSPPRPYTGVSKGRPWGPSCAAGGGAVDAEPCLPGAPCPGFLLCCVTLAWLLTQGACSFQVVLINAIKDGPRPSPDLIGATKELPASHDDPSMYQLKGGCQGRVSPSQGHVCQGCPSERLEMTPQGFGRGQCILSSFLT